MNKQTTDKIFMILNYFDDDKGERHYDLEGLHNELEEHKGIDKMISMQKYKLYMDLKKKKEEKYTINNREY